MKRKLNAYYAEFQPLQSGKARLHHHTGVKFLSILAASGDYISERKTTFSNRETQSISIPPCHIPTEESVSSHVAQSLPTGRCIYAVTLAATS